MIISFYCRSCNAALKIDESFAGRTIRCPRCAKTTQIPFVSDPEAAPPAKNNIDESAEAPAARSTTFAHSPSPEILAESASTSIFDEVPSTLNPFEKICAGYEPNPFALSVPLDAPETLNDVRFSGGSNVSTDTSTDSVQLSDAKSDVAPNADAASQMFYREEFMRRRGKVAKEKIGESRPKTTETKSPSVNDMIADLLKENEK